jgi:hypothetical protein
MAFVAPHEDIFDVALMDALCMRPVMHLARLTLTTPKHRRKIREFT